MDGSRRKDGSEDISFRMHNNLRRNLLKGAVGTAGMAIVARVMPAGAQVSGDRRVLISGVHQPELTALDELMDNFVKEQRVPGAELAVTKDSRLVYARGFGMADRERQHAVQPTDLFRIASVSKAITAVAVLQLIERARLSLGTKVWDVLNLSKPSDARWTQVTILHLLRHTGGWDDPTFDAMFQSAHIAKTLNVPLPIGHEHIIRFMLGRPLQFDPGSRFAYSNFGYCLLGRVVERITSVSYDRYVQQEILAPLGIRRMRLGKTLRSERAPTEVVYYDDKNRTASAVVGTIGARVPLPYGAWSLEVMDANGGWLASAVDLVRFASAFDNPASCPILHPNSIAIMYARPEGDAGVEVDGNYAGCGWFVWPEDRHKHRAYASSNGLVAGTSSYLMRRRDGVNWAVLFNARNGPDGKPLMIGFRDLSSSAFDKIQTWPKSDQFSTLPSAIETPNKPLHPTLGSGASLRPSAG
jgi:N-acyl-D-amino-acid deacylase